MVNENKIKVMTEIALEESKKHKEEIAEGGYFKGDYILSHVTSIIWSLSIAYFLCFVLVLLYQADYLMINIAKLPYHMLVILPVSIYVVLIILVGVFTVRYYSAKYRENQIVLEDYNRKLEDLQSFYTETGEEKENDAATGV